jgi:hypothetical protein
MSQSPFRYRPTLVSHPGRGEPLPVFTAQYDTAEFLADAPASGHRVFTTLCNESAWRALERLDTLNYQLAKTGHSTALR